MENGFLSDNSDFKMENVAWIETEMRNFLMRWIGGLFNVRESDYFLWLFKKSINRWIKYLIKIN